jgi:ATP/maltotriose-dependent transcriptional regulator MalT
LLSARAALLDDQRAIAEAWFKRAEEDASSSEVRGVAMFGQFLFQWEEETGDLALALRRLEAASDGSAAHELRIAQGRFLACVASRNVSGALEASRSAQVLLVLPADPFTRLASLNQHAWALVWAGKYEEAHVAAERALTEADESGIDFVASHAMMAKVNSLIGLRKFAAATQAMARIDARLRDEPDGWVAGNVALARARLQISLGDIERAADELLFDPDPKQNPALWAEYYATRGLLSAARGSGAEAEKWLALGAARSTYLEPYAISAVTRTILATEAHDPVLASRQFALALQTGHHDSVVMGCRAFPSMAKQLVNRASYQHELRSIFRDSADGALAKAAGLEIPKVASRSDQLSPRELEVFELMAHGRTNRQIAQTLFIAESTTKVHVRHIFEKLGVRSRVEAVRVWGLAERE